MRKFLFLILVITVVTSTSCEKYLDQQPMSELSTGLFWKNADDVKLGMAGMYDAMQRMLAHNYIDWAEPRSDNFKAASNAESQLNLSLNALDANAPQASWSALYAAVSQANFALKYIPRIAQMNAQVRDNYLAQAYAMRAYCYFYAIRLWGDVPLWLEPYEDLKQDVHLPRTPVDEILQTVIVPDLEKAAGIISPTATGSVWEISAGSILAMLTEVYAWKNDPLKVLETSQRLMALNKYKLAPAADWKKLFTDPGNTPEAIWSMHWAFAQDGASGMAHRYGSSNVTAYYFIDSNALKLFEANPGDIRRHFTYDTTLVKASTGVNKIGKFYPYENNKPVYPSTTVSEGFYPLYRYADVLLLRAEAYNAINAPGYKTAAVKLLNEVRERAKVPPYTESQFTTQEELETAILNERQVELFGECKRWFDLVRTGRLIAVMDPVIKERQRQKYFAQTGFGDPRRVLLPISRTALNENPKLTQNPPYSE